MSTLFVVATPIGNLQDVSLRAVEILKSVPLIAAEDTRVTRKLLNHIGSKVRTLSYNENSAPNRLRQLLEHLESADLALVTDAGTPAVSDPGSKLVREAAAAGHIVTPVPGPSSATAALSVSGFDSAGFAFIGFLPRKRAERKKELAQIIDLPMTLVLLEAPHRVRQTLESLSEVAPERDLVICRELTKLYEEVFRGGPEAALNHFENPRGEFVILIAPAPESRLELTDDEIRDAAQRAVSDGLSGRSAVQHVISETGAPRSRAYPAVVEAQKPGG